MRNYKSSHSVTYAPQRYKNLMFHNGKLGKWSIPNLFMGEHSLCEP